MPLRDHFRKPLSDYCPWESFHGNWATKMVDRLNADRLTENYTAQSGRHFGAQLEVDVGTLERDDRGSLFAGLNGHHPGGTATATTVYSPPATSLTAVVGFDDPDLFEVKVYRGGGGWNLVAAVELVSKANKDRDETRRAFAVKCASYLQKGISLLVVDPVTIPAANLHDDICEVFEPVDALRWASPTGLSVVVYRATRLAGVEEGSCRLDVWPYPLAVGSELPTVPLWLAHDLAVPLELELTYENACRSLKIR